MSACAVANTSEPSRLAVVLLGVATGVLQTLALREAMAAATGHEAVVASVLGVWMLATAVGAQLGRTPTRNRRSALAAGFMGYGVLCVGTLVGARAFLRLVLPGVVPSLTVTWVASALLLSPSCVLSGWIYAQIALPPGEGDPAAGVETQDRRLAAQVYWLDALGFGLAGAALGLIALDNLLPFRIASIAVGAAMGAGAWIARGRARPWLLGACIAAVSALWMLPLDSITTGWQLPGQQIDLQRPTSRGPLVVTESAGQRQLLLQRMPLAVSSDVLTSEQLICIPLALHPAPRRVLVVGAVPMGSLSRAISCGATHVDQLVGDPKVADLLRGWDPDAGLASVRVFGDDERSWVRLARAEPYDVVIVNVGLPASIATARLYSTEFYEALRRLMRADSVLAVAMPGHASYSTHAQRRMHSSVAGSLRMVFSSWIVLPTTLTLYVASDAPLAAGEEIRNQIEERLADRRIEGAVLGRDWLENTFSPQRLEEARRWASLRVPESTDLHPIVLRLSLDVALEQVGEGGTQVLAALGLLVAGVLVVWFSPHRRPVPYAIATTGFAGLSVQLLLMLIHQTAVGALYRDVALVTAAFMVAGCAGTWWAGRRESTRWRLVALDLLQVALSLLIAVSASTMMRSEPLASRSAVLVAAATMGALTGGQVAMGALAPGAFASSRGGGLLAVDLAGACIASLAIYTVLVPWLGISATALCVVAVKTTSVVALAAWGKRAERAVPPPTRIPLPALILVLCVAMMVPEVTEQPLYALSVSRAYAGAVLVVLASGLAMAFEPVWLRDRLVSMHRRWQALSRTLGIAPLRLVSYVVLVVLGALPIARCYFRVPYLFCHACPRPCAFGLLRPYVVTAALLANIGDRRFCERMCPLGSAQQSVVRIARDDGRRLGPIASVPRWVLLAAVVLLYLVVDADDATTTDVASVFSWFYSNTYAVSAWALVVAGGFLIGSFFVTRPFCDLACPIGAASDLIGRLERRLGGATLSVEDAGPPSTNDGKRDA